MLTHTIILSNAFAGFVEKTVLIQSWYTVRMWTEADEMGWRVLLYADV